jgi:hypothetical protein
MDEGVFPRPLVVMRRPEGLSIIDGSHRMAAFEMLQRTPDAKFRSLGKTIEPLAACFRHVSEASDALDHAQEVSDFQAVRVRCREALLAFTGAAQIVSPWTREALPKPKQAEFKTWVDHGSFKEVRQR